MTASVLLMRLLVRRFSTVMFWKSVSPPKVKLVSFIYDGAAVKAQPHEGAVQDGCADLAFDVVAQDGQPCRFEFFGPLHRFV